MTKIPLFHILVISSYLVCGCDKSIKHKETSPSEVKLSNFEGTWKCVSIVKGKNDDSESYPAAEIQGLEQNSPSMEFFVNNDHSFSLRSKHHEIVTIYKGYLEKTSDHTVVAHKVLGPVIDVAKPKDISDTWIIKILDNHIHLKISKNITYIFTKKISEGYEREMNPRANQ